MLVEFKVQVEIPEDPVKLAENVYNHIYIDDYYDDDSLNNTLYPNIAEVIEIIDFEDQLPAKYVKQYYRTLNKLKQCGV